MKIIEDLMSIGKVVLLSKSTATFSQTGRGRTLAILGNGPSLRQTIDLYENRLRLCDLMTVNFAANTPDFSLLRPRYHILADSHFFTGIPTDDNVRMLWENIKKAGWDLTLLVPVRYRHLIKAILIDRPELKVDYFNMTPVEGSPLVSHFLIGRRMGMPRPRNVLIPAIMCGIWMGYPNIWLFGADHSWTKTLDVSEDNTVVSVQPHFYQDNDKEHNRVRETYKNIKLHEVLDSMAIAFRSYWQIRQYAEKKEVKILNFTPGSMIDAFERSNF